MQMRGKVRFRFRSSESEIDVLIEGEYDVVNSIRDELGLQGRVGFIQPLSARLVHGHVRVPRILLGGDLVWLIRDCDGVDLNGVVVVVDEEEGGVDL